MSSPNKISSIKSLECSHLVIPYSENLSESDAALRVFRPGNDSGDRQLTLKEGSGTGQD